MLAAGSLFACNNKTSDTGTVRTDSSAKNETANLPYLLARTPDWEKGNSDNVAIAMNTLKAFEVNDMNALQQYLADSVEFYVDNLSFRGTKDSLVQLMTTHRRGIDTMWIRMHDYETVKSKDRGEEWVSLWYTETTKPNGKNIDSTMVMDDIKIVNGKVALIDSKIRHLVKN